MRKGEITKIVCYEMERASDQMEDMRINILTAMGHSDIGVTLNTYTHMGFEDASAEMRKVIANPSNKVSGRELE